MAPAGTHPSVGPGSLSHVGGGGEGQSPASIGVGKVSDVLSAHSGKECTPVTSFPRGLLGVLQIPTGSSASEWRELCTKLPS